MDIDRFIPGRALGGARALLNRVVDLARTALTPSTHPHSGGETPHSATGASVIPENDRGISSVSAAIVDSSKLLVSWKLDAQDLDDARHLLGGSGTLCARIVVVSRDDAQIVRSDITDRSHVDAEGEWLVPDLPSGAHVAAAVGLQHEQRFVSAGHASSVVLP